MRPPKLQQDKADMPKRNPPFRPNRSLASIGEPAVSLCAVTDELYH
jgi:hypothetical protein